MATKKTLTDLLSRTKLTPLPAESLASEQSYESIIVQEGNLELSELDDTFIERSHFSKTELSKTNWQSLELLNVLLSNCTAANANWLGAVLSKVEFQRTRLTGLNLCDARLQNVLFYRCKLDFALFHNAQLADCRFEQCILCEADFQRATLRRVVFRDCDLRNARYPGATFQEVDLRGSQLAGMQVDVQAIQGTTVDPMQVADLASLLGLVVEDVPA